jgi:GT2 family glycosyltransferase
MGVIRADRSEVFNGWNKVKPQELTEVCRKHGLEPAGAGPDEPREQDPSLYLNVHQYPHAAVGAVFFKGQAAVSAPRKKLALGLLTWNTASLSLDSIEAYAREAKMLDRLGVSPLLLVCDNGSTDGMREALEDLDKRLDVPHSFMFNQRNRGSSVARNQMINAALEWGADYLLFMDGDIEIIPFSSFAMFRHMENAGHPLGCVGLHSSGCTPHRERATTYLFSLADYKMSATHLVAWTQYGLFRCDLFRDGVRFDETEPFDREGWGFEDNDLAFQMHVKGYHNYVFSGAVYLHRNVHSSMKNMRVEGLNPRTYYEQRRQYVLNKWKNTPAIDRSFIRAMQISTCPAAD